MIVVVAPYAPIGRTENPHLGAARKIEIVVSLLSRLDTDIVLVNSAHNDERVQPTRVDKVVVGGVLIREITLPCINNRQIGKLLNLLHVRKTVKAVLELGKPAMVWVYNAYAFESLFALTVRKLTDCPIVLEFEDWHFSRTRGMNPKPYIDYLIWRFSARAINHVFAVNEFLAEKMRPFTLNINLLPGIVPFKLEQIATSRPPFDAARAQVKIGYFGGLTYEKGADLILRLAAELPCGYSLQVTGGGEMESDFVKMSESNPQKLHYHGKVNDDKLYALIEDCDVIVNPHSRIEDMDNGVFPFKVIEAIASGRLLVSTPLPITKLNNVLQGMHVVENNFDDFLKSILNANNIYQLNKNNVRVGAKEAAEQFGEDSFLNRVKKILG